MAMPIGSPVIDLMIGPSNLDYLNQSLMDVSRRGPWSRHPAEYMFKDVPDAHAYSPDDTAVADRLIAEMDRFNIVQGIINFIPGHAWCEDGIKRFPDRLIPSLAVNPNHGMDEVRRIVYCYETFGIKALTAFPAGLFPAVPINDKMFYPVYAKAVELNLPVFLTVGVPGPRVRFAPQAAELLDEICWFFPDLVVVTRHGGEPWADLLVKLMLKYPNLYYSTSAFAPRYYPQPIMNFANSRGRDKIMYAGYYPLGISLDRIFAELPGVPFRDEVWAPFLHENARRVLKL
jgi:predicted TIM-barrel fold metal-dependent hydrolase